MSVSWGPRRISWRLGGSGFLIAGWQGHLESLLG